MHVPWANVKELTICTQFHDNAASILAVNSDVEVAFGIGPVKSEVNIMKKKEELG